MLHTFLHPVIVIFSQHMTVPAQPILLQYQCYVIYTLGSHMRILLTLPAFVCVAVSMKRLSVRMSVTHRSITATAASGFAGVL